MTIQEERREITEKQIKLIDDIDCAMSRLTWHFFDVNTDTPKDLTFKAIGELWIIKHMVLSINTDAIDDIEEYSTESLADECATIVDIAKNSLKKYKDDFESARKRIEDKFNIEGGAV